MRTYLQRPLPMATSTRKMKDDKEHIGENSKQGHFRLLDLPPELQLRIFECSVCQDGPIVISDHATLGKVPVDDSIDHTRPAITLYSVARPTQPALTRTCRSVRVDALKFYYSGNTFTSSYCFSESCDGREDCEVLATWLRGIGATNRGLMGSVEVYDADLTNFMKKNGVGRGFETDRCVELAAKGLEASPAIDYKICELRNGVHTITFPKHESGR
ncbi:hypothetical protein LTR56_002848 [Elasticomyces elasticus]|nr:hypothetical protein LTR56_002848 [Elasticomyces elasticus]KAK3666695.1 hypothetical protein LTR22_002282 [Elasticomyces elasticus]KAK4920463.1 hypothetical protein LTR49_012055 [Elasticomyces elasticus]KAK5759250.1 hypothetical protein LTS12_010573 [Elasticomyces elasticus]